MVEDEDREALRNLEALESIRSKIRAVTYVARFMRYVEKTGYVWRGCFRHFGLVRPVPPETEQQCRLLIPILP
jgi:hypothetical protein